MFDLALCQMVNDAFPLNNNYFGHKFPSKRQCYWPNDVVYKKTLGTQMRGNKDIAFWQTNVMLKIETTGDGR